MSLFRLVRKPFRYTFSNAVLILIGCNIAVYMLTQTMPFMRFYLALNAVSVLRYGMFWQFFTYLFVHQGFSHLFFNMLGLLIFGINVERTMGSKEFVLFYLTTGVLCGVISFFIYTFTGGTLVGASGAIYAVLLAYAVLFPRSNIYIWGILPIPAPVLIAVYAGIEIVSQLLNSRSGVAHMTHLAGFALAWIYFMVRMGINPWKVWKQNYF